MTKDELNKYRNMISSPVLLKLEVEALVDQMTSETIPDIQHTRCSGKSCQNCANRVKCVSSN